MSLNQVCENVDEILDRFEKQIFYVKSEFIYSFDENNDENCLEQLDEIMDAIERFKKKRTMDALLKVEDEMLRLTFCADYCQHIVLERGDYKMHSLTRKDLLHLGYTEKQIDMWIEDLKG